MLFEENNSGVLITLFSIDHLFPLLSSFVSVSNCVLLIYGVILGYGVILTIHKTP